MPCLARSMVPMISPGKSVATIGGSTAETWVNGAMSDSGDKIRVRVFTDIPCCLQALKKGKVKAVVHDAPILHYYVRKIGPDHFETVDNIF